MSKLDPYELEVLEAYESGKLKPIASKAELQRMRAAARATAIKDKRVNIRLSSADLLDIQAKALAEGMPYQTLIASVLHKYAAGKLAEKESLVVSAQRRLTPRSSCAPTARHAGHAALGLRPILRRLPSAPCRRRQLSSNVSHHRATQGKPLLLFARQLCRLQRLELHTWPRTSLSTKICSTKPSASAVSPRRRRLSHAHCKSS